MLRNTIEWRAKTDLVGKMRVWRDIPFDVRQKTYEGYQSGWYSSHTSLGCPVYIERTGKLHLAKVLKLLSADDVVDHHIRMMEWMMRVLMPEMRKREAEWSDRKAATKAESMKNSMEGSPGGSPGGEQSEDDDNDEASPYPASDKVINVLDMSGLSTRILGRASIEIFKRCLHIDQSFFPEIMYRCYVVNCPAMFRVVWAAVKPLLDKQIQKKIFIYGKVAGRVKDEMVDLFGGVERVPSFLGGECKRELFNCPPWVLKHMDDDKFVSWEVPIYPEAARG